MRRQWPPVPRFGGRYPAPLLASVGHGLPTHIPAASRVGHAGPALRGGVRRGAMTATSLLPTLGLALALAGIALVHASGRWRLRRERRRRQGLQRRIAEISDNLPVVVFQARLQRDGHIQLDWLAGDSPQLFSASPRELKSDPACVLAAVAAQHRRRLRVAVAHAMREPRAVSLRFIAQGVRGPRHVSMQAWPRSGADGAQHWTGYWMDVSDEHARGQAIAQAHAQAQADADARGRLLATLGSGIGGPMQGLQQRIAMLREGPLDGRQQAALESLEDASAMLARILDDVLALSATDEAGMTLEIAAVDLRGVLGGVQQLLLPVARAKGLRLDHRIDHGVARWLQADATRLRQILFNLVGNAIKFTEHGEVRMVVQVLEDRPASQRLRIEVSDTGVGIAPERQQAVFEPFTQADASTPRRYGGTGLGLGICQRLVRRMGGGMVLHSCPGHGTVVSIELCLERADAPVPLPADEHPGSSAPVARRQPQAGTAAPRVLVAEDHPTQQLLMQWWLRGMGVDVDVAADGAQALALWREGGYVLLLTDERMPRMDGVALVEQIRREEGERGSLPIPIIGMSADVDGMRAAALAATLVKPISRRALHEVIERVLPGLLAVDPAAGAGTAVADAGDTLDPAALARRFGGEETARELVRSLRASLDEDLQALLCDWQRDDRVGASQRLHRMAGGLGSLGLSALAVQLRELSDGVADPDAAQRRALQARLQRCLDHLRELERRAGP